MFSYQFNLFYAPVGLNLVRHSALIIVCPHLFELQYSVFTLFQHSHVLMFWQILRTFKEGKKAASSLVFGRNSQFQVLLA